MNETLFVLSPLKPVPLSQSKATANTDASKTIVVIENDYEALLEEWESI